MDSEQKVLNMKTRLHHKRNVEAYRHRNNDIQPPHRPRHRDRPRRPGGHADEDEHVDDGGEAHGKGAQEQGLGRMADHGEPYFRIERIP